ncbi:MAG TPA: pirin-like C-terminal cupin domain-containing protein, partial [bacterium]|nr:pirin-like C-terminal cupin domain-containing protein [bacterium]
EVTDDDGTRARVVCGELWGARGPVVGVAADPNYIDISVPPGRTKTLPVETSRHAFVYVFAGSGRFDNASEPRAVATEFVGPQESPAGVAAENRSLILFDSGDEVTVHAGEEGIRFLLVTGKPIGEPVAWRGPIVMNTEQELEKAWSELQDGTFLKG